MTDNAPDNRALLRRTLTTACALVGACVLFVGSLTLVATGIVAHAIGAPDEQTTEAATAKSPAALGQAAPGSRPALGSPSPTLRAAR